MKKIIILLTILTSQIALAQNVPSYVPTNGLVAWWPFSGNAVDSSGNGNNGTVNGATLTTDRFGNANSAYNFPGSSSSYIDCGSSSSLKVKRAITMSAWIFMDGGNSNPRILSYEGALNAGYVMFVNGNSNISRTLNASFYNTNGSGGGFWCTTPGCGIITNSLTWKHIVFTMDSIGNANMYINGNLVSSMNGTPVNNSNYVNSLNIGRKSEPAFDAFGGKLDDIGIWNRALTPCEIQALYTSVPSSFNTNLIAQDTIKACGDSVLVAASSGLSTYVWNTGATTSSIFAKNTGWYKVTGANTSGCSASDSVFVSIVKANILNNDSSVCLGSTIQIYADTSTLNTCNNTSLNSNFSLVCPGDCFSILKFDANNYFVTTRLTVLKSNGICNANWQNTNWTLGIVRSNTSIIGAIEKQGNRFFVASLDNGDFLSTNLGATYQSTGLAGFGCGSPYIKTLPSGNTIMSMGGFLRGIYKIAPSSNSWVQKITLPVDFADGCIDNFGGVYTTAYSPNHVGGLYKSTNDGDNWINIWPTSYYNNPIVVDVYNDTIYVCTNNGKIYKSHYSNINFILVSNNNGIIGFPSDLFISNSGVFYLSVSNSSDPQALSTAGLYISYDKGLTWIKKVIPNATQVYEINNIDNHILIGSDVGLVEYKTQNLNSFLWSSGATTSSINVTPTQTTKYWVQVSNGISSCTDTVTITVQNPNAPAINNVAYCQGATASALTATSAAGNTLRWYTTATGGTFSTTAPTPSTTTLGTTTYYVSQITPQGCESARAAITVNIYPWPTVNAGPDKEVPAGTSVDIITQTTNAQSIAWSPVTGLSCISCTSPTATVNFPIVYVVTVTSAGGCSVSDTIAIRLVCEDNLLYMPNTFTPNGDGENDRFYPMGKGLGDVNVFRIVNRLGQVVYTKTNFSANDESYGWDGTFNGSELGMDVYSYYIEVSCATGQVLKRTGDISLLR